MNSFAPPTSSEKSGGGRWGESRGGSSGGRWGGNEGGGWGGGEGGRFGGSENRRWGNATGSSFQNGGEMPNRQEEWNEFYKRRFEATEQGGGYNNAAQGQAPYAPPQQFANGQQQQYGNQQQQFAYGQGAAIGGNFGGYSQPGQSFSSTQAMRAAIGASAVRRMLRNGDDGNFNRVYSSNSGGFNRIYGGQ